MRLTRDNLAYYDRLLTVSRDRFKAGDIAKVDLVRLELQRVQFEPTCKPRWSTCARRKFIF